VTSRAAERMRASRARRRDGYRCLTIEIHDKDITALIAAGTLDAKMRDDPGQVSDAIYRFFESRLWPADEPRN